MKISNVHCINTCNALTCTTCPTIFNVYTTGFHMYPCNVPVIDKIVNY